MKFTTEKPELIHHRQSLYCPACPKSYTPAPHDWTGDGCQGLLHVEYQVPGGPRYGDPKITSRGQCDTCLEKVSL